MASWTTDSGPLVLSLCDRTGVMVEPWRAAGFDTLTVDKQPAAHAGPSEVADMRGAWLPERRDIAIVFAFPPCTHLANSGARWMKDKGLPALIEALVLVERCRVVCEWSGAPWMLENPMGQLSTYWRKPDFMFDPCEFAGYCDDPAEDAYTKRTCLWVGRGFQLPLRRPWEAVDGSRMHLMSPGPERANERSVTPRGFARAVFEANVDRVRESAA